MSALHPGPGLICTTCGQFDCRRAACDSPTQRHVTREEYDSLRPPSSGRIPLCSPETRRVRQAFELLKKVPKSKSPGVRVARTALEAAFVTLLSELANERAELECELTRDQLIDRDQRVHDEILNLRRPA